MTEALNNLTIRTGVVLRPGLGYLLACDPTKEESNPHVKILKWMAGSLSETWEKFNAHTACQITIPEEALVFLSISGKYGIYAQTKTYGNIFENSQPQPIAPRYGDIRAVSEIGGKAHAVAFGGCVYRLDKLSHWSRIDDGLPSDFDIEAIHGFGESDVYAAGFGGQLWHYDGHRWTECDLPSNTDINCINCAQNGIVYLAGNDGMLICGRGNQWKVIEQEEMTEDVWDLEWFMGELYASTFSGVYRLKGERMEPVDFGDEPPKSTYHLSGVQGMLWSIGEFDVVSFNGTAWTRVF